MGTNVVSNSTKPVRRSSRVDCAIPMKVSGVDAWRGPYTEQVSTLTISAHGCKYQSAHQVLNDSVVILEFNGERNKTMRSARGRVKYVRRPSGPGLPFETAIELDHPGNVWGLDEPPNDWSPFVAPKQVDLDTSKHKPFTLTSAAVNAGGFQQQLERVLSDAAATAVHEKTQATFEELRPRIDEEVRKIVWEATRTVAASAIEDALKRIKTTAHEVSNALRAHWSDKIEAELSAAREQVEKRRREIDDVAESLSLSALDKLQNAMEASRKESVDRIVERLKEQSAPLLDHAQTVIAELDQHAKNLSAALECSIEESNARIEESHAALEQRFEKTLAERLSLAEEEFASSVRSAVKEALEEFRAQTKKQENDAKTRFQSGIEAIVRENLDVAREKVAAISQKVAGEIEDYSRNHLELVGSAITELAKGMSKKGRK